MPAPILRPPTSDDAPAWADFLTAQQAIAYAGIVPPDFVAMQDQSRAEWIGDLARLFAHPGSARRIVAEVEGQLVAAASIIDGPNTWEIDLGYVPAPADRELSRLYVAPKFKGTGLADRMLATIDDGRAMYLWLIEGNIRGHRYYLRRGFIDLPEHFEAGEGWGRAGMHRMLRPAR